MVFWPKTHISSYPLILTIYMSYLFWKLCDQGRSWHWKNDVRSWFKAARNFFFTPDSNRTLIWHRLIPIFQWRVSWPNKLYLPFRAQLRKNHILDGCSWHQCREVKKVGSEFCRLFNGFDSYSTVCIAGANEIISRNCFKSWKSQVCIFPLR